MLKAVFGWVLALICITGCAPQFTTHPAPETTVNMNAFMERGCTIDRNGELDCPEADDLFRFCTRLYRPRDALGALTPTTPIAVCQFYLYLPENAERVERPEEYLFGDGGLLPVAIRYVMLEDEEIRVIATEEELRETFAPIESAEEALAYAVAATNLDPRYNITYQPGYQYDVSAIEDTHVEAVDDGWRVNLFHYQVFGCGPHYHQEYDVYVSADGDIRREGPTNLYRDPEEDQMCVD